MKIDIGYQRRTLRNVMQLRLLGRQQQIRTYVATVGMVRYATRREGGTFA